MPVEKQAIPPLDAINGPGVAPSPKVEQQKSRSGQAADEGTDDD
jgi:hypothetical protein